MTRSTVNADCGHLKLLLADPIPALEVWNVVARGQGQQWRTVAKLRHVPMDVCR